MGASPRRDSHNGSAPCGAQVTGGGAPSDFPPELLVPRYSDPAASLITDERKSFTPVVIMACVET